ncbi:MAG: type II toxin-antitoxin system RelE/ParE family toxin [bacterium]
MMFFNRFFGYKYIFSEPAKRDLKKLDKQVLAKIISKLDDLVSKKECLDVKMMVSTTPTQYRLRVGDYRVIFVEQKNEIIIVVIGVGHRREIYNRTKR